MRFYSVITLLFLLICTEYSYAAEVGIVVDKTKCFKNSVVIDGTFGKGDAEKVGSAIDHIKDHVTKTFGECIPTLELHSPGGEINEALRIGLKVRDSGFKTLVRKSSICYSSCVVVFAAGVDRISKGEIGIHRPYFADLDKSVTVEQIRATRSELTRILKEYFRRIDVSELLVEEMLAIPPDKVSILSESEMAAFRITGIDPSYEEFRVAKYAKLRGLSSAEYRKRDAYAEGKCNSASVDNYFACRESHILGIAYSESQARHDRWTTCLSKVTKSADRDNCFVDYYVKGKK